MVLDSTAKRVFSILILAVALTTSDLQVLEENCASPGPSSLEPLDLHNSPNATYSHLFHNG